MPKQKEIIQTIADERIATVPTVTAHESFFNHTQIHAPQSDNQDLSGLVGTNDPRLSDARTPTAHVHDYEPANANIQSHISSSHLQFEGLAKITVGTTPPSNPSTGDLWINTNT